ncbi:MAG: F0F1 ATP synthase subunit B [Acidimicrobiia bacterium]
MGATKNSRRLLAVGVVALGGLALLAGPAAAQEESEEAIELAVEEIHHAEEEGLISHETAECAISALENDDAERCHESPSPILPASNEILWGSLSFLVLLGVMWKFGIPAATNMMNERTERIRADLDAADTARAEAQTVLAGYQAQLAESRNEANRVIEEARQQAEQVRRDLVARAEAEAAELRARNVEQLATERDRVLGELRGQVASLAVELAEKVVESSLDREASLALIESYIDTVGTNGSR